VKPAIGGGMTNTWPWRESMSSIMPREASASRMLRVSVSDFFQSSAAVSAVKGLIGS